MSKEAAAAHDHFNLYAVTPLVVLTFCAIVQTQPWAFYLSVATLVYIIADIVYNALVPECQPNTTRWATIMLHHVVTLWLVLHPVLHPENAHLTAACTIVEVNTLILTVNRNLKWKSLTYAFYFTWVTQRLIWYPYLIYLNHVTIVAWGAKPFDYFHCQTVGTVAVLCALNFVWTAEVVMGLLKKPQKKV
jgi:hypothetical protein